jgi:glycosyltransferase involved in cell wall biosynthesis
VELVHFCRIDAGCPRTDVNLFVETIAAALFPFAKQQWFIPNQEWFAPWDHAHSIQKLDRILCKTQDAVKIMKDLYPAQQNRVQYIGFESRDLYDPSIARQRKFLHVAGQSRYKNSPAVAYAFAKCFDDSDIKDRRELVFVGAYPEECQFARESKNVRYIQRASETEIKQLANECQFCIMPAGAEGWGHVIHEALGCGAVVITTDFAPMNEFAGCPKELYVKPQRDIQELAARRAMVGAYEVADAIRRAWALTPDQIAAIQTKARVAFLAEKKDFRERFKAVLESA